MNSIFKPGGCRALLMARRFSAGEIDGIDGILQDLQDYF
jgi:hypothetical protein